MIFLTLGPVPQRENPFSIVGLNTVNPRYLSAEVHFKLLISQIKSR